MAEVTLLLRGQIYWIALNAPISGEAAQLRPALVLSNDIGNRLAEHVIVAPISSSRKRVYPFEVQIAAGEGGLDRLSKVLLDQIRTVDNVRIGALIGGLGVERMREVDAAIRISLHL